MNMYTPGKRKFTPRGWLPWLVGVAVMFGAGYAAWKVSSGASSSDARVMQGLQVTRSILAGETYPHSPEGYTQVAKIRQEMFCKDSGVADVRPKGRITVLKDQYNTTVLQIHPLPAYLCVYGGAQDFVSQSLISTGTWESHELNEVSWALQVPLPAGAGITSSIAPALVVDIGANLGAFAFNLAARGYEVIAFEGMQANQYLMRTCMCVSNPKVMQRVTFHALGVGASRSKCYLVAHDTNRGDGIALCDAKDEADAINQLGNRGYKLRGVMQIEALDNVIQRDVKVMKVDVEGFEPFVMAGARKLLTQHKVWFLIIEYNKVLLDGSLKTQTQTDVKRVDFVLQLVRMGYRVSNHSFKGPFITEGQLLEFDKQAEPSNSNLYFVHQSIDL